MSAAGGAASKQPKPRTRSEYVGRFAPSPSGPLHAGSLLAAIGSWLDARAAQGRWLLRFDDLDTPRNIDDAQPRIIAELQRLELLWDGELYRQSDDLLPYQNALQQLAERDASFACACSRKDLRNGIYPGTCRAGLPPGKAARSTRLRVDNRAIRIDDAIQGPFTQQLQSACGDFVLQRADGVIAYHLATVVDDAAQGITHVVRGADLLDSSPRQVALQQALDLLTPHYAHLPLLNAADGCKLSKQNHAPSTESVAATTLWLNTLQALGLDAVAQCAGLELKKIQDWALANWQLTNVPKQTCPLVKRQEP